MHHTKHIGVVTIENIATTSPANGTESFRICELQERKIPRLEQTQSSDPRTPSVCCNAQKRRTLFRGLGVQTRRRATPAPKWVRGRALVRQNKAQYLRIMADCCYKKRRNENETLNETLKAGGVRGEGKMERAEEMLAIVVELLLLLLLLSFALGYWVEYFSFSYRSLWFWVGFESDNRYWILWKYLLGFLEI